VIEHWFAYLPCVYALAHGIDDAGHVEAGDMGIGPSADTTGHELVIGWIEAHRVNPHPHIGGTGYRQFGLAKPQAVRGAW
jgi:hypothetical protein